MSDHDNNSFIFVLWSVARGYEQQIIKEIERRFEIVRSFEVTWPKRHFTRNLAAFYGWKSWHTWWNKARKCGTGPFLAIVVKDPRPVWKKECDTYGHVMVVDENVYLLKKSFRALTGRSNVVHSSVTPEETAHQLAALAEPCNAPIPFRKLFYEDDARLRTEHRKVWLGFGTDLLIPFTMALATGGIVWASLSFSKMTGGENHLVEWAGLTLSAVCGTLLAACSLFRKICRGAYALFAAFFFDMAIREADHVLDRVFDANLWPWILTAVTATFSAVTLRYAKTVFSGIKEISSSRHFPFFTCGASLLALTSLLSGRAETWQAFAMQASPAFRRLLKEGVEFFGHALMFAWTISHIYRVRQDLLALRRRNGKMSSKNETAT